MSELSYESEDVIRQIIEHLKKMDREQFLAHFVSGNYQEFQEDPEKYVDEQYPDYFHVPVKSCDEFIEVWGNTGDFSMEDQYERYKANPRTYDTPFEKYDYFQGSELETDGEELDKAYNDYIESTLRNPGIPIQIRVQVKEEDKKRKRSYEIIDLTDDVIDFTKRSTPSSVIDLTD